MTTSSGRSTETRRAGRSVGQWLLGLLIILALAASILMVFTDQLSVSGTLAVIAALWAAVIGAILVTKFRKQAESAEAKSRDLRLVYELQLEREIAARRQYELDVESTIRKEVAAETGGELAELKAHVTSLRSSLERLLGVSLPDDQVALPNEKLRELASGLGGLGAAQTSAPPRSGYPGQQGYDTPASFGPPAGFSAPEGFGAHDDGIIAARDFAATAPSAGDGRHLGADADPNEMTEVIPVITDDPGTDNPVFTANPVSTDGPVAVADFVSSADSGAVAATPSAAGVESPEVEPTGVESPEVEPTGVESTGAEAPQAEPPRYDENPESAPFSGAFYVGPPPNVDRPYTDDSPTDEWEHRMPETGPGRHESATYAGPADQNPANSLPAEPVQPTFGPSGVAPYTAPIEDADGAEESSGGGRRRRRDDAADADSAHSNGLPVAELLSQLRRADTVGGGRRRRED